MMHRRSMIALGFVLVAATAFAQDRKPYTAAEMQALVGKGIVVSSSDLKGGKDFTGRINLGADGRLSGSVTPAGDNAIAVTGNWKLKGAQLCRTLAPIQPDEICETWTKSGPKEAVIQVDGKDASLNRW